MVSGWKKLIAFILAIMWTSVSFNDDGEEKQLKLLLLNTFALYFTRIAFLRWVENKTQYFIKSTTYQTIEYVPFRGLAISKFNFSVSIVHFIYPI